jgi:hypothetical protein
MEFPFHLGEKERRLRLLAESATYYWSCVTLSGVVSFLFTPSTKRSSWFVIGMIVLLLLSVASTLLAKNHPRIATVLYAGSAMMFGVTVAVGGNERSFLLSIWFLFCGLGCRGILRGGSLRKIKWELYPPLVIFLFLFFSIAIYGDVKFQFGGGAPIPLSLYLTPEAPQLFTSTPAKVWLVEQTDAGWYVVRSVNDRKSIFIPRALVRAIEFEADERAAEQKGSPAHKDSQGH